MYDIVGTLGIVMILGFIAFLTSAGVSKPKPKDNTHKGQDDYYKFS